MVNGHLMTPLINIFYKLINTIFDLMMFNQNGIAGSSSENVILLSGNIYRSCLYIVGYVYISLDTFKKVIFISKPCCQSLCHRI